MARTAAGNEQIDATDGTAAGEQEAFDTEVEDIVDGEFDGIVGSADPGEEGDDGTGVVDDTRDEEAALATGGETLDDEEEEGLDEELEDGRDPAGDRGDGRNARGEFVGGADKGEKGKQGAAADGAAPQAGAADAGKAAAAAEAPKWEPLVVRADKALVPIEELSVMRGMKDSAGNELVMVSMRASNFARFAQRLSSGHRFEQNRQAITEQRTQLEAKIKHVERELAAPRGKTDAEVEGEELLKLLKPLLPELVDANLISQADVDNLELRVKLAQRDARDAHATALTKYHEDLKAKDAEATAPAEYQTREATHIAEALMQVWHETPELKDLPEAEVRKVYDDLIEIGRAVYREDREQNRWEVDPKIITKYLTDRKTRLAATPSANGAPPSNGNPAAGGTRGAPAGSSSNGGGKTAAADRHNRAVDTGQRRTSSLKANRGTRPPERNPRERAAAGTRAAPTKTPEMEAEDAWNTTRRNLMRSSTLDFEGDDDE
jgi:hypothetical protein